VTLIDPETDRWLCCGLPVHAAGCAANLGCYRDGSEPTWSVLGLTPQQVSCRDCGVSLGQRHHDRCCLAICRHCDQQQLTCACDTTIVELVQ
jgi:hypothetical protein